MDNVERDNGTHKLDGNGRERMSGWTTRRDSRTNQLEREVQDPMSSWTKLGQMAGLTSWKGKAEMA